MTKACRLKLPILYPMNYEVFILENKVGVIALHSYP